MSTLNMEQLDVKQVEAINAGLDMKSRIVAITGPAGSGKTSIMRFLYERLTAFGYRVVLCAPTGKAAKRIQEATGIPALTIHRLLEYPKPGEVDENTGKPLVTTQPKRDQFNPLNYDAVLCDEYAMVNHEVHRNLVDAFPAGAVLRAFGDRNQLPPIEPNHQLAQQPSPFEVLLKRHRSVVLETIHRQGEGSGIVAAGARIIKGWSPVRAPDFDLVVTDKPVEKLHEIVHRDNQQGIRYDGVQNQILTATNISWIGTRALNTALMSKFVPSLTEHAIELPRHKWEEKYPVLIDVGMKVINNANWYNVDQMTGDDLYNGESGIVKYISALGDITIDLGDRELTVPSSMKVQTRWGEKWMDPRKDLTLAYAVTTHKAQGSEYEHVVYVINKSTKFMLNRNQLYTAITRARKRCTFICDGNALSYGLWNVNTNVRR